MAMNFNDANSERVDIGNPSVLNFNTGDFTIMCWFKTTTILKSNLIGKGGNNAGGIRYIIALRGTEQAPGRIKTDFDDNVNKENINGSSSTLNDDEWHHGAAVRDGSTQRLYVDGVPDGTNAIAGNPNYDSSRPALLGAVIDEPSGLPNEEYDGDLDDARYYNRALSAAEIATIFAENVRGHDGIVDGLQARFTFMEKAPGVTASGADVKDIGPNSLATTSVNTPTYSEGELTFRRRTA